MAKTSRQLRPEASVETSIAQQSLLSTYTDMSDQSQTHPTLGRRRRHKSPASIPSMHDLLSPRLLDHLGTEDGPSDAEEEEKEAKHQTSTSTTPRSASGTHDYDMVMGIAPVEPQESERFEEGKLLRLSRR